MGLTNRNVTPHVCPVCSGNGLVPNGFYNQTSGNWSSSSMTPEKCRSCDGSGVIWSPENIEVSGNSTVDLSDIRFR